MGCDGGTIPKRDELVKTKKKPEQKDKMAELVFRWRHCALSQEPLHPPVVACELGKLYNKEKLIEALLDKSNAVPLIRHIRGLKDITTLNLTENPVFIKGLAEKGDAYVDTNIAPYICPVVGIEMNGKYKFVFNKSCGCVMSERAVKEIKCDNCHKCQKPLKLSDLVLLNPTEEEAFEIELKLKEWRAKDKLAKQDGSKRENTDALEGSSKRQKNGSQRKKGEEISTVLIDKSFSKVIPSYSVAKDPSNTDVYKSLFNTHESAKKRGTAHWVTYNPFYN